MYHQTSLPNQKLKVYFARPQYYWLSTL